MSLSSMPSKAVEVTTFALPSANHASCRHGDVIADSVTSRVFTLLSDSPGDKAGAIVNCFQVNQEGKGFNLMKEHIKAGRVGDLIPLGDCRFVVTLVRVGSNWEKSPPWEAYIYDSQWKEKKLDTSKLPQPGKDDSWYLALHGDKFLIATPESTKLHFFSKSDGQPVKEMTVPKLEAIEKVKYFPNGVLAITSRHGGYRWNAKGKNKYDVTMYDISGGKLKQVGKVKDVSQGLYAILSANHLIFGRLNALWRKNEFLICDYHKPDETRTVDTKVLNPEPIVALGKNMILAKCEGANKKIKYSMLTLS